jgi:hypothetical protein
MYRRSNLNAALYAETTRKSHHFGAVALHWEISDLTGVGISADVLRPSEDGADLSRQYRLRLGAVAPFPKCRKSLAMHP